MKPVLRHLTAFTTFLLTATSLFAADLLPIPHLPAELWKVDAGEGDKVSFSTQGEVLVIDYDVDVKDWLQIGHQSLKQASVKLLLKEPVVLSKESARIVFEGWGHGKGTWQTQDRQTHFRPLLRDASGEWLSYTSYTYPHLKNGAATWSGWMSNAFFAAEAGGATQDVFEAWGGDGNAWPDGELRFVGFEITVRRPEFGRVGGRVALGEVAAAPTRLPYQAPYAYLDSLAKEPGTYTLSARASQGYQHPPLIEQSSKLTLVADDLASAKQKVTFNLGSDGEYWIDWQLSGAAGTPVGGDTMRYHVLDNPVSKDMPPFNPTAVPVMGHLRINWAAHLGGVYGQGEPMAVAVRVFPKGAAGPLTLEWSLQQSRFDAELQSGSVAVPAAGGDYSDLAITPTWLEGRDAYRLSLVLKADGKTIDTTTYELGRATDLSIPRSTRTGKILDRDYVKQGAYFRLSYLWLSTAKKTSEDDAVADFETQLDAMSRMTRYVTYMIDVRDLEVLPGVYDFAMLDRIMDAAADRGVALTVRFAHVDQLGLYTWHPYFRQYNYDGTPIYMHFYGGFSLVDERHTEIWHRAYKSLHDRYATHPGFQGYYVMEPAGEATVADKPWEGIISGYDPAMPAAFQHWLQTVPGYSLDALNARWGTAYAAWADVELPLPNLALGTMPDLRLQWVDFNRFKVWLDTDGWFPGAAARIRAYDPNHVIIAYGSPQKMSADIDYGHNGGNHMLKLEGQMIDAWEKRRTGWINEPHHPHRWAAYGDPAEKGWVLDWTLWVSTAQSGAGGMNFHAYFDPRPGSLVDHYGTDFAFDRMQKYLPICEELHRIKLVEHPFQTAVLQDLHTLYCKHRTTFMPRADDLRRWFERLKDDSVRFEEFDAEHLAQYKLILPNLLDEVMSEAHIQALDTAVRENGAKVIITARTGTYCPERGDQPFQLLRQFGIAPPTTPYTQDRQQVTAKVAAANPLFEAGKDVEFFSLADLQRDLQSEEVRKNFWKYPFRWIPQTDYFGVYLGHQPGGDVWASFADGGAAVTRHQVGKGEVVVFWGMPNYAPELMCGFMTKAAAWAGVVEPTAGAPIPRMLEASAEESGRHYVLLYHETPGTYAQPMPATPDGSWFVEELVADRKLGTWTGEELRGGKLPVTYQEGASPLKVYRLTPRAKMKTKWVDKYRTVEPAAE